TAIGKVVPLEALSTSLASPTLYGIPNKNRICFANTFKLRRNYIRVLFSFRIIAIASYQFTTPLAGVDVDPAHFQPTTDQPISISTYKADECFGAIRELPK
ncbi:hypothetical protein V1478_013471, partial [Vespula squamosa]